MTASNPVKHILFAIIAIFIATGALVFATKKSNTLSLRKFYENQRASGKLHPFGDAVLKSLLGASKVTSTPSAYGIYKDFSILSTPSNPCAAPVLYGSSFGLNVCYPYVDYDTNQTFSNLFKYNSTFGTRFNYNSSDCSGPFMAESLPLNTCNDNIFKLLPSSSSPVVSTKSGASLTVYGTQQNCLNNTGKGIQGMIYQATTTNNCFTYDTLANLGNSSSWTCVTGSITYLEYNETSNCYGQVSYGSTFPISEASCQQQGGDIASGWVRYGCNQ